MGAMIRSEIRKTESELLGISTSCACHEICCKSGKVQLKLPEANLQHIYIYRHTHTYYIYIIDYIAIIAIIAIKI